MTECTPETLIVLPLVALIGGSFLFLGIGYLRKHPSAVPWTIPGPILCAFFVLGGLLVYYHPEKLSNPLLPNSLIGPLFLLLGVALAAYILLCFYRRQQLFLFRAPPELFLPRWRDLITRLNLPLDPVPLSQEKRSWWKAKPPSNPQTGGIWRLRPNGPDLWVQFFRNPQDLTWYGNLTVQGKGNPSRVQYIVEKFRAETRNIELKPRYVLGLTFFVLGILAAGLIGTILPAACLQAGVF